MIIGIDTDRREVQTSDVLTVEAAQRAMEILSYVVTQMTKPPTGGLTSTTDTTTALYPRRIGIKPVAPKKADFDFDDPEKVNAFLDQMNAARRYEEICHKNNL